MKLLRDTSWKVFHNWCQNLIFSCHITEICLRVFMASYDGWWLYYGKGNKQFMMDDNATIGCMDCYVFIMLPDVWRRISCDSPLPFLQFQSINQNIVKIYYIYEHYNVLRFLFRYFQKRYWYVHSSRSIMFPEFGSTCFLPWGKKITLTKTPMTEVAKFKAFVHWLST